MGRAGCVWACLAGVFVAVSFDIVSCQSCLSWQAALAQANYPAALSSQLLQTLDPFFSGTVFLPPAASLQTALNSTTDASSNVLQYHLIPSLAPSDPAIRSSSGLAVKTLLDSTDAPSICPATKLTETTLTYTASSTSAKVNGVAASLADAIVACNGVVVPIQDVLQPRCLPPPGGNPCAVGNTTVKVLQTLTDSTAAAFFAEMLPANFTGTIFLPSEAALTALFKTLNYTYPPAATATTPYQLATDLAQFHILPGSPFPPGILLRPTNLSTLLADAAAPLICDTPPDGTLSASSPPLTFTAPASDPLIPSSQTAILTCKGVIYPIDTVLLPCTLNATYLKDPKPKPRPSPSPKPSPTTSPTKPASASSPSPSPSSPKPRSSAADPLCTPATMLLALLLPLASLGAALLLTLV